MRSSPSISPYCKFSIKKSEILTFQLQKRGDLQGLVKGLFLTGKKFFPVGHSPRPNKSRAFSPHRSNRGAGLSFHLFSRPHRAIWGSALSGNLPPISTLKIEYTDKSSISAHNIRKCRKRSDDYGNDPQGVR